MSGRKEKTLRLILGDQLYIKHSWFQHTDPSVIYVLMEMKQETGYVKHHVQKILAFFSAMRIFCKELKELGHEVIYFKINDPNNTQKLNLNLDQVIQKVKITRFEYLLPDEYRLDEQLKEYCNHLSIPHTYYDTEHFYTFREELKTFFKGKSLYRMENFYRHMRKKHGVLMEENGKDPLYGQWNFDTENRKKLPKNHKINPSLEFINEFKKLKQEVDDSKIEYIGTIQGEFLNWPVNRNQSLDLLRQFCENKLLFFGTYQDAMSLKEFDLYHSRLSFSMNSKLISPSEVIEMATETWKKNKDKIEFNQLEGFVRQIIGWREYMRGIYWAQMPEYKNLNYFKNSRKLPTWYWDGKTKMKCLSHSISQSLETSYAHHIQRLMITGNFALLAGLNPDEVDEWYLGIYIDAIEWVEITNTRGMSQFADGGLLASKPYVSSGSYIHKMSDYCESCHYKVNQKTDAQACPFNSLYWNFIDQHQDKLKQNPRMSMIYSLWNKTKTEEKIKILERADFVLKNIEAL